MMNFRTLLIGIASALCLLAGAALLVWPAKAQPMLGDAHRHWPDPAYQPGGRNAPMSSRPNVMDPTDPIYLMDRGHAGRDDDELAGSRQSHSFLGGRMRGPEPITVTASVSGNLARDVKVWRATRLAIAEWRQQVRLRRGPGFDDWRVSSNRQVSCADAGGSTIQCTVSAVPEPAGHVVGAWRQVRP